MRRISSLSCSERVEFSTCDKVGARIDPFAAQLLRSHVCQRSSDPHYVFIGARRRRSDVILTNQSRQPKVEDLDPSLRRDLQVGGLQVAVVIPCEYAAARPSSVWLAILSNCSCGVASRAMRVASDSPGMYSMTM